MEKKLKIALAIVTIIAIVEFLLIASEKNTTIQSNSDTNIEYANENKTKENTANSITIDEIKSNIVVEYAGIAVNGDFVLKVTNNNNSTVVIDNIEIVFKDENNIFSQKEMTYNNRFGIQPNKITYVYAMGFQKDFSKYPNYEFNINLCSDKVAKSYFVDNFEVKANDSGEQIAVEVKNNNDVSVEDIQINAIYYKNNEIIGIESGSDILSNATSAQSTSYINVDYPEDSKYNKINFDNYEVFLMSSKAED